MGPGVLKRRGLLVESKVGGLIVHLHYLFVGKAALPMSDTWRVSPDEVDQLLRNAELRDKLEPYLDDAVGQVNVSAMPTHIENEYLESMLAWEHAPVMPIGKWFEPELQVPDPHSLDDRALHQVLWRTIEQLFQQRIVLDFGDHLSDRELYTLIYRDIVPAKEKKIDSPDNYLHWDCADVGGDAEVWLRYYATVEERRRWAREFGDALPTAMTPPYPRKMPRRGL